MTKPTSQPASQQLEHATSSRISHLHMWRSTILQVIVLMLLFIATPFSFDSVFVTKIDLGALTALRAWHNPTSIVIMRFFTEMGGNIGLPIFAAVIFGGLWITARRLEAMAFFVAALTGFVGNNLLKFIYNRERPSMYERLFEVTSSSFPSGHAMCSILCYGMAAYLLGRIPRLAPYRVLIWIVSVFMIAMICLSRVFFAVHYPSDVWGGLLVGGALLLVIIRAFEQRVQTRS
jgi:undecaprenyl-diphosphatase